MIKAIKILNYIFIFFSTSFLVSDLRGYSTHASTVLIAFLDNFIIFIGISILITIFEGILKIENKLKNSIKIQITKDDE